MATRPSKKLETFQNPAPERDYRIRMEIPEFMCLCPMTGQPDFATLLLFMTIIEWLGRNRPLGTSYLTPGLKQALRAPLAARRSG